MVVPNSVAALATEEPPPGWNCWMEPIGGSTTGMRIGLPSSVRSVRMVETSLSTFGRNASDASAIRLRITAASESAPPRR